MFGWFKGKNQTAMEKLVEDVENRLSEEKVKTCIKVKLHMKDGRIFHINTHANDTGKSQYYFDNDEGNNFLLVPLRQVDYVDIGDTIRMTKDMKYGFTIADPKEKPEYRPKRNRLKEIV